MKLIIAGSRHLVDVDINNIMYHYFMDNTSDFHPERVVEVISGGCNGIDKLGEQWAKEEYWFDHGHTYKKSISIKYFIPDWKTHGKAAGPIRNRQMAEYGDALLLIWDGKSRGSASMKKEMEKLNKPIYEIILKESNETK